jgi:O-antigen/teichoic acid export membrane protein
MEEINIETIKQKTTVSVVFLSLRNIGIQAISALGYFILTLILGTGDVGLFAIVAVSVGILSYFSDIGLASALIQQKDEVTKDDLRTTFVIQQILVLLALFIVFLIYPNISRSHGYGPKEMWIVISLCFSFACASLKTIPSVLLERKLNFKLLSTVDIIENTLFYTLTVIFALLHFGVYSYAIATFIRSFIGLIVIYTFSPWEIGIAFSLNSIKKLFKFGIPYQLNSFIAMAKDKLSDLFVAGIVGRQSFGILSFAQNGPQVPMTFMDAIMRVTFPTFSRIQEQKDLLKRSIEKSIYYISFFIFPALAGIALIAPDVINIIPKYGKWLPAVIPLYFYATNAAIAAVTTPLTNAFNAVGKITITTRLMIMWTVLTWIFYPLLSYKFGYIGTAAATLIVGSSSFIVWYIAHRVFSINIVKTIFHPVAASLLMVVVLMSIGFLHLNLFITLPLKVITGILIYVLYNLYFSRTEINWFLNQTKWLSKKK